MRFSALLLLAAALFSGVFSACKKDDQVVPEPEPVPIAVTGVTLTRTSKTLAVGTSLTLQATVLPSDASNKNIEWSCQPTGIVQVTQEGRVEALAPGSATVTVTTQDGGFTATCAITIPLHLNTKGTANCYIVPGAGTYSFPVNVMGNGAAGIPADAIFPVTSATLAPAYVEVLWETGATPGALIARLTYDPDIQAAFVTTTGTVGNAVIAAYADGTAGTAGVHDAADPIIWSWHLWMTPYDPDATPLAATPGRHTYYDGSLENPTTDPAGTNGVMMDRNLGALVAGKGSVWALGMYYQWGRKDPFIGPAENGVGEEDAFDQHDALSTTSWTFITGPKTMDQAIAQPTTFITQSGNWIAAAQASDYLWSATQKTIYDPCPAGWHVPVGTTSGIWKGWPTGLNQATLAAMYDASNLGVLFDAPYTSAPAWYPAAGYRVSNIATLQRVGTMGYYWSASAAENGKAYHLHTSATGTFSPANSNVRAYGFPVRCQQD